ncbi:MAG: hypothetical protein RL199_1751 [Pseudomonadota bacterium]|jgi:hypothetical protein
MIGPSRRCASIRAVERITKSADSASTSSDGPCATSSCCSTTSQRRAARWCRCARAWTSRPRRAAPIPDSRCARRVRARTHSRAGPRRAGPRPVVGDAERTPHRTAPAPVRRGARPHHALRGTPVAVDSAGAQGAAAYRRKARWRYQSRTHTLANGTQRPSPRYSQQPSESL